MNWLFLILIVISEATNTRYSELWENMEERGVICFLPPYPILCQSKWQWLMSIQNIHDCFVMHTDLSEHLHNEDCNILIQELEYCHKTFTFRKYLGHCNQICVLMEKCLKKERQERSRRNREAALIRQKKWYRTIQKE